MPQNAFFLRICNLLVSQKTKQRHFFSTLHPLSSVIFATATVLAFVLLRDSSFNFHCYTQREATPTQKSARKCAATSRNILHERLQSAFTLANQLRWIAQHNALVLGAMGFISLLLGPGLKLTHINPNIHFLTSRHTLKWNPLSAGVSLTRENTFHTGEPKK